jgi:hypothetical protein
MYVLVVVLVAIIYHRSVVIDSCFIVAININTKNIK